MSDLSNTFEQRLYDWLFRPGQAAPTRPSTLWLALFTAVSNAEAGTGTEVSGGSYARVEVTSAFGAPTDGAGSNTGAITWPAAPTANWGTVTHFGLFDASSGGNAVTALKALQNSRVINSGDAAPSFASGQLTVAVA